VALHFQLLGKEKIQAGHVFTFIKKGYTLILKFAFSPAFSCS